MSSALGDLISCSIADATALTGIGRTRIYELIRDGAIDVRYEKSKPLVIVASLDEYVRSLPMEKAEKT